MTFVNLKSVKAYRQDIFNIIASKLHFSWLSKWYDTKTDVYYITYEEKLGQLKTTLSIVLVFLLDYRARSDKRARKWPLSGGEPRDTPLISPSQVEGKSYVLNPMK